MHAVFRADADDRRPRGGYLKAWRSPPFTRSMAIARRFVVPLSAYLLVAVTLTWPLVLHPRSRLGALGPGDPSLNLWILGWDLQTLSTHPGWLATGRIFEANIFFPAHRTLAYSDHLILQALALWPAFAASHDLVLCYNVLLLASLTLSALAMHAFVRGTIGGEPAAYVSGLIFGFAPYHFTHLVHLQLQALYFLPLTFLSLFRVINRSRSSDVVALGAATGLQAVSSVYYGVIGGIGLLATALVLTAAKRRWSDWRLLGRLAAAAAIATVVALPSVIPYWRIQRDEGMARNLFEAAHGSAVLASYVQAPVTNVLYGRTGWLRPVPGGGGPLGRREGPEEDLFPGFVPLALAVCGAIVGWRRRARRDETTALIALGAIGVLLSLGPTGIRPVYAALHGAVFGMQAIRAPARFSVLALFAMAALAAMAIDGIAERRRPFYRTTGVVAGAILLEYFNGAIPYEPAPPLHTAAGAWLAKEAPGSAVVCLPLAFDIENTSCMLESLEHHHPIVNGYSGSRPPFFAALVESLSRFPSGDSLLALHDVGVTFIVSPRPFVVDSADASIVVERARFGDARIYQLVWTPAAEEAIAARLDLRPPPPGPPPFAPGELATYRVRWTNGPMTLPAGRATIGVTAPRRGEGFRFVVEGRTADWVARFFQVDARIEAGTTPLLLPIVYDEFITEGHRDLHRRLTFDPDMRRVHLTTAGTDVTLPVDPNGRDPLSALFYARTLPLASRERFALPLSDGGRNVRLDLTVVGREALVLDGKTWATWRLEPKLVSRVDRRDPPVMTVWLTADERRVPLAVDVSAAFGSVRVELESYRAR